MILRMPVLVLALCFAGCNCDGGGTCGDGTCDADEDSVSCPEDCPDAPFDGGLDGGGGDGCELRFTDRDLLQEAISIAIGDTMKMLDDASQKQTLGASLQLVGVGWSSSSFFTNRPPCVGVFTEAETCTEDEPGINVCTRIGCAGNGVQIVERYLTTAPNTDPADRSALTYDLTQPGGLGIYDPNPFVTWTVDKGAMGEVTVSADIDHGLTVQLFTGETIDLSHAGTVSGTLDTGALALTAFDLELFFLAIDFGNVSVAAALGAGGSVDGTVHLGPDQVGTFSTTFDANPFVDINIEWIPACLN